MTGALPASLEALELVGEGLVPLLAGAQGGEQRTHALGVGGRERGGERGVGEAAEQALVLRAPDPSPRRRSALSRAPVDAGRS